MKQVTGHCYCGNCSLRSTQLPSAVVYCHCDDCRRVSGAPVSAFAAFDETAVTFESGEFQTSSVTAGVTRTFCKVCGSPIAGRYDYLPGKVFLPIGILDQADQLEPQLHAHHSSKLCWFEVVDDLEKIPGSSKVKINAES